MKVKIEGDAGAWGSWWYICPKCHEQVDYKQKTCNRCGEVLDWNDYNKVSTRFQQDMEHSNAKCALELR